MFMTICIVAVALQGAVALITYNALAAETHRNRQSAALAAQNVLNQHATDKTASGGALDSDVSGFSDVVVIDTRNGRVLPYTGPTSVPAYGAVIQRRWRFYTGTDGARHLGVATRAVTANLQPIRTIGTSDWVRDDVVMQV